MNRKSKPSHISSAGVFEPKLHIIGRETLELCLANFQKNAPHGLDGTSLAAGTEPPHQMLV